WLYVNALTDLVEVYPPEISIVTLKVCVVKPLLSTVALGICWLMPVAFLTSMLFMATSLAAMVIGPVHLYMGEPISPPPLQPVVAFTKSQSEGIRLSITFQLFPLSTLKAEP